MCHPLTVLLFVLSWWSSFDCATARDHKHQQLRDVQVTISAWNGCTITGTIGGVSTTLFMDVASCPLHAKVPGTFWIRYDPACGAVLEITDGARITTPMPPSCPTTTPTPVPTPTPPTPTPTAPSGTFGIQGYVYADGERVPGAVVSVAGKQMASRDDAYFWFDSGIPLGAMIEVSKSGYEFPRVTVIAGTVDQLYFVSGRAVSQPSPTPTATPVSTPSPQPSPTAAPSPSPGPTPQPAPQPSPAGCEMALTVPTLAQWSSGNLVISITSPVPQSFSLTVTATSGQVWVVPPVTQSFTSRTSLTAQFKLQAKRKSGSVIVSGPCGDRTVMVQVR